MTEIRWYGVPPDRPVLPYPSFVANEAWHNENGPVSGMDYGWPPSQQGTQLGQLKYESVNPRDDFNPVHVCGTRSQWAGELLSTTPGRADCCNPFPRVGLAITPHSAWVRGSNCPHCGSTPTPRTWWVSLDFIGFGGRGSFSGVFPVTGPTLAGTACSWSGPYTGPGPWTTVTFFLDVADAIVTLTGGTSFVTVFRTDPPGQCNVPLPMPMVFSTVTPSNVPTVEVFPYDPHGRRAYSFAGKANGPGPHHAFTGVVGVRITPRSAWTQGRGFGGFAALAISPDSLWSVGTSFDGASMQQIAPSSSWGSSIPTDCSECPFGINPNIAIDPNSSNGVFAALAGGFSLTYTGSCTYATVVSGISVTAVAVGGNLIISVDDGMGNTATLQSSPSFSCLGANFYTVTADSTDGNMSSLGNS